MCIFNTICCPACADCTSVTRLNMWSVGKPDRKRLNLSKLSNNVAHVQCFYYKVISYKVGYYYELSLTHGTDRYYKSTFTHFYSVITKAQVCFNQYYIYLGVFDHSQYTPPNKGGRGKAKLWEKITSGQTPHCAIYRERLASWKLWIVSADT